MLDQIDIVKTVLPKQQTEKVLNRNFSSFVNKPVAAPTISLTEFFQSYEQLYFQIPPEGETSSHRYLINKSSELINIEQNTLDIQPLLDEISSLREQLLASKMDYITAQQQIATLTLAKK